MPVRAVHATEQLHSLDALVGVHESTGSASRMLPWGARQRVGQHAQLVHAQVRSVPVALQRLLLQIRVEIYTTAPLGHVEDLVQRLHVDGFTPP